MEDPWLQEQRAQERYRYYLNEKPDCERCGRKIPDIRALNLNGCWYCSDCVRRCTREVERG